MYVCQPNSVVLIISCPAMSTLSVPVVRGVTIWETLCDGVGVEGTDQG